MRWYVERGDVFCGLCVMRKVWPVSMAWVYRVDQEKRVQGECVKSEVKKEKDCED